MGILEFITKISVQTAVYWGGGTDNGFGKKDFDAPREINVRWEQKTTLYKTAQNKEIIVDAIIFVSEDLSEGGLLYLGNLSDFTPLQLDTPYDIEGAYQIKIFEKIPLIKSTTKFVRKVYVTKL